MSFYQVFIFSILAMVAADAFGQAKVGGLPRLAGTGCPKGTASATFSPDGRVLSVLFDAFIVEAGSSANQELMQKECVIRFPVSVPPGETLAIESAQFRGGMVLTEAPAEASLNVHFGWFFPFSKLHPTFTRRTKVWLDATNEDYIYDVDLTHNNGRPLWTTCGAKDVTFELGATLRVHMFKATGDGFGSVDSLDAAVTKQRGIDFYIRSSKCVTKPTKPVAGLALGV